MIGELYLKVHHSCEVSIVGLLLLRQEYTVFIASAWDAVTSNSGNVVGGSTPQPGSFVAPEVSTAQSGRSNRFYPEALKVCLSP